MPLTALLLLIATLLPLASIASMLSTCAVNETTLAMGASVPTTNAGPVFEDCVPPLLATVEPPQPAVATSAALNGNNANFRSFIRVSGDILGMSLSACIRDAS